MADDQDVTPEDRESRRTVVKKIAYVTPVVFSLMASPALASSGSARPRPKPKPK